MKKQGLMSKLKRSFYTGLTAASIGLSSLYGCSDVTSEQNREPIAEAVVTPTQGYSPLTVNFDGSRSKDPDGFIEKYIWVYDDGKSDSTSGTIANHTYEIPGSYSPSLTVEDNSGMRNTKTLDSVVVDAENQIVFSRWDVITNDNYDEHIYKAGLITTTAGKDTLVNLKKLTNSVQDLEPIWSFDGNYTFFTSHRTGGTSIWKMDAKDGNNQTDISSHLVERARQANQCSNGLVVVAYRDKEDTEAGIGIMNLGEDSFKSIYSEPISAQIPEWPKWSPDCSEIAYQRYINGNWEIYTMDANGNNQRNLTNNPATDSQASYSPNGEEILFSSNRNGNFGLHLMSSNGNYIKKITSNSGIVDPNYSPDGSNIIFAYDITIGSTKIYVTNSNGIGTWTQLTFEGKGDRYPTFRPRQK